MKKYLYYYASFLASGGSAWLLWRIMHAAAHALGIPHAEGVMVP